jgi:mRNA interferase MazF
MKKGEIFFANLAPTLGSEVKKTRPVLIVSNDVNNKISSLLTVIPLTSQTDKVYPFEVFLDKKHSKLSKDSKAQCNQIRTISKIRLQAGKPVGKITSALMEKIHQAIQLHLGIS